MSIKYEYHALINKHFAVVQTETRLDMLDNDDNKYIAMEKKARLFAEQFQAYEKSFLAKIEGMEAKLQVVETNEFEVKQRR
jgi:hypothetical protein